MAAEIGAVITEALRDMAEHGYSESYIKIHREKYDSLKHFCAERQIVCYTAEVGQQFIDLIMECRPARCLGSVNLHKRLIRRLNCAADSIEWSPIRAKACNPYTKSCFDAAVIDYEAYLQRSGKRKYDVRNGAHIVSRFLKNVEQNGCTALKALDAQDVYAALQGEGVKPYAYHRVIKPFLKYAYTYGLIQSNLALIVPSECRRSNVPTVYSPDEVEELLASIDRSTPSGKRSYAAALIAARLGLRASDIAGLTFSCLHLETGTIELVQSKTKTPLTLPLLDDVRDALFDYIDNGRPKNTDEHIFLNMRGYGVMSPVNICTIVTTIFNRSGINCEGRRHGPHALRSSLATALLAEGNDYAAIRKTLGQRDMQSSKAYARAEVEQLRVNALPVPLPTGQFKAFLSAGGAAS